MRKISSFILSLFLLLSPFAVSAAQPLAISDIYKVEIEEAFPSWVKEQIETELLDSLHYYHSVFAGSTQETIPVSVRYNPDAGLSAATVSNNGGMALSLGGEVWQGKKTKVKLGYIKNFIRHETFHVWHIYYYPNIDIGVNSFMMEGAADYYVWTSLQERRNENVTVTNWLNGCASSLGGRALIDVAAYSKAKANYLCGAFINWLLDRWLADQGQDLGVSDLWRDLFQTSLPDNFSQHLLLERLFGFVRDRLGDEKYVTILREIIYGSGSDRWVHLLSHIQESGIQIRLKRLEEHSAEELIMLMFKSLLGDECEQTTNWMWTKWGISSLDDSKCKTLKKLQGVQTINGVKIPDDALEAFLMIRDSCQRHEKVRMGKSMWKRDITLKCGKPLNSPPVSFMFGD